mmetsp:Transcript_56918/g.123151  ORF Transcript_56918/g.123151 Transcript_56918/m.123151 type:complete len:249 (+) Transcript_56918:1218-1964(+)
MVYPITRLAFSRVPLGISLTSSSCRSGLSTTPVYGRLEASAAVVMASKGQNHSVLRASTRPFFLQPVKENFVINFSKRSLSMSLMTERAFEASWIGPPNRANSSACSMMETFSVGTLQRALAAIRPPTPPPAIRTRSGFSSLTSSERAFLTIRARRRAPAPRCRREVPRGAASARRAAAAATPEAPMEDSTLCRPAERAAVGAWTWATLSPTAPRCFEIGPARDGVAERIDAKAGDSSMATDPSLPCP